jgi:putative FmdB family regulatory protein
MEAIHKVSDAPLKQCPECKQETLRKLVSAAAFKLTGTGWYETDFKDKKPKTKENKNKEDRKVANNKDGDKTEKSKTKTSEKSESKASNTKKKETTTTNPD